MAYRHHDSFDLWAAIADAAAGATPRWDSSANWNLSTTTRFGQGRSFALQSSNVGLVKTGFSNSSRTFTHVGFVQTTALGAAGLGKAIQLRDGATNQCSICFRGDGSIILTSGGTTGTTLSTYTSAFVTNSYDSWQFEVVIHNTLGQFNIRKNNILVHSATGLNTRGGTANDYSNAIALIHSTGTTHTQFLDDYYHWDDSGAAPITWVGDIRPFNLSPVKPVATAFTNSNSGSLTFGKTDTQFTRTLQANILYFTGSFIAVVGGTFTQSFISLNGAYTGNIRMALYESNGDTQGFLSDSKPGRLVAVSDVKVNGVNGDTTITWPEAVGVVATKSYHFAILTSAPLNINNRNINTEMYANTSYAAGFPASVIGATELAQDSGFVTGVSYFRAFATLTMTNHGAASDQRPDGVVSYVLGSTVGIYDMYELEKLPYDPSSIVAVHVWASNAKSDAGAKTMRVTGDILYHPFETADHSPLTTFGIFNTPYHLDPTTSAAWTKSAVDGINLGPKVQA